MSRSRIVLMVTWGLLAAGSVIHFVQTADDARTETDERATAAAPDALADRSAGDVGSIPPNRSAENADSAAAGRPIGWPTDGARARSTLAATPTTEEVAEAAVSFDAPETWATRVEPAVVATVTGPGVASRTAPGSGTETHWFANPTQFGGTRTFLVVDDTSSADYVKVSLPVMPNGQEGWIPRAAVELSTVSHRAEVDLSEAVVTVWDGERIVATTRAVTGRASAPTPLGRFYVRDIIAQPDPDGDYGPWILALSGFSEVLTTFNGGLPALALHGTDEPEQLGSALSSGCVRVPNDVITALAETVPLGTPVTVVA